MILRHTTNTHQSIIFLLDKNVDNKIAITENTNKDELTLELDEDPATVSAYAVYERNR